MKTDRPHRVPLATQVLSLLEKLHRFEGTELLFPGRAGKKPLSDMALNQIMRRMPFKDKDGRQCVPHGLRSTFSDWGADRTAWHEKDIEMALAHAIGDETVGAYRRGDLFEKRSHLMSDWANFLESPPVMAPT
jgi:integrase